MEKTKVVLVGENGNVFNLLGIAARALKRDGKITEAEEMTKRAFSSHFYEEVINIISEYCEIE